MVIHLRSHSPQSPPSVKALSFSKGVSINPFNLKVASNFRHESSSFAVKAYQNESDRPEKLQPKRSVSTPSTPKMDSFKEPEPKKLSLKFLEAKQTLKEMVVTQTSMDYQQVLKYPLVTESAIKNIIEDNTLVFMVDVRANKKDIRNAFENMLKIKTKKINTLINYDGTKKAYIQLSSDNEAVTVAKKMKILA